MVSRVFVNGSVLLVSLVLLLVMTVAGLTGVKMATLDEKVSGNYQDQQMAFYAAEAALKEAEQFIADNQFTLADFTASCTDGYCFPAAMLVMWAAVTREVPNPGKPVRFGAPAASTEPPQYRSAAYQHRRNTLLSFVAISLKNPQGRCLIRPIAGTGLSFIA